MAFRIASIGVGAIGGTLAGFMSKEGEDVLLIDSWKDHVDAMNNRGLTLDGITGEHKVEVKAIHTDQIPAIEGTFDIVVVAVKSYDTQEAVRRMLPYMRDDTWVISPQNSINEHLCSSGFYSFRFSNDLFSSGALFRSD